MADNITSIDEALKSLEFMRNTPLEAIAAGVDASQFDERIGDILTKFPEAYRPMMGVIFENNRDAAIKFGVLEGRLNQLIEILSFTLEELQRTRGSNGRA